MEGIFVPVEARYYKAVQRRDARKAALDELALEESLWCYALDGNAGPKADLMDVARESLGG